MTCDDYGHNDHENVEEAKNVKKNDNEKKCLKLVGNFGRDVVHKISKIFGIKQMRSNLLDYCWNTRAMLTSLTLTIS